MEEYIKWLENKIEVCLEDKDLQRDHWAFYQSLKKFRELALTISTVVGQSDPCSGNCGMNYCDDNGCIERKRILVEPTDLPVHGG